jgi:hypothetical protein
MYGHGNRLPSSAEVMNVGSLWVVVIMFVALAH